MEVSNERSVSLDVEQLEEKVLETALGDEYEETGDWWRGEHELACNAAHIERVALTELSQTRARDAT